jgi:uncharacterized protein YjbJ (UPF0337 family)
MNSDVLKGRWKQIQGKVRQQWGKLTDDDLAQIKGDRDVLMGRIQERYGQTREEAQEAIERWLEAEKIEAKEAVESH